MIKPEAIQTIIIAVIGGFTAWLGFKGKKVDGHISDNQTIENMFNAQAELIDNLRSEIKTLKDNQEADAREFNSKIKQLSDQNIELLKDNKNMALEIKKLNRQLKGE